MSKRNGHSVAAAIDIGSNSIKMTVGQLDPAGKLEELAWASEVVRLGYNLDLTGRLDDARIDAAAAVLGRFAADARELGATRLLAVATEATRAAANGAEFLARVRVETGIDVRAINGDEESRLTFTGLAATGDVTGNVVVADVGGASTEIILATDGVVQRADSLPLGSGRLTDKLGLADPPGREGLARAEEAAADALLAAPDLAAFSEREDVRLVILGGTGEYMVRLLPDETAFGLPDIGAMLERLSNVPAADIAELIEIPEARARVLPAGVAIVEAIAARLRPGRIEVARSGIRAGLLLEALAHGGAKAIGPERKASRKMRTRTPVEPEEGFRETMRRLIGERWAAVWGAIPAALEGTDIEGVHAVRVASRRLRAAMDTGAVCFPARWYKPLHAAAKEITGALGEVRDRDVLLESLRKTLDAAPPEERPGIERLVARVERERVEARAAMEEYLRTLLEGGVPFEVERRFGPGAAFAPADGNDSERKA